MNNNEDEGSIEFSFAGLFKCMLCTHPKGNEEKVQLMHISSTLEKLEKKLETVERLIIYMTTSLYLSQRIAILTRLIWMF